MVFVSSIYKYKDKSKYKARYLSKYKYNYKYNYRSKSKYLIALFFTVQVFTVKIKMFIK
jgi:hypothetical protein